MLSHDYSYPEILKNSLKVAWTERQVLEGRDFDYSKRFLPNRLSGVDEIGCLKDRAKNPGRLRRVLRRLEIDQISRRIV